MSTGNEIATQAGHWYAADGTPYYTIIGANGKERGTTLRDARKLNLYPSVTTILRTIAKPGLDIWKQKQVLLAALTLTRNPGESDDDFCDRIIADSREQSIKAMDTGTQIHGAIELAIQGKPYPVEYANHITEVFKACSAAGIDLMAGEAERSFAHEYGFAGKCDWHSRSPGIVLDFKTTEAIKDTTKPYLEHGLQLAAYAMGLSLSTARRFNVFIGVTDTRVKVCELPATVDSNDAEAFMAILEFWQITNGYKPAKAVAA